MTFAVRSGQPARGDGRAIAGLNGVFPSNGMSAGPPVTSRTLLREAGALPSSGPASRNDMEEPMRSGPLKFVALDTDDLKVVSSHLQDAEVKVADVHWRPQERRL